MIEENFGYKVDRGFLVYTQSNNKLVEVPIKENIKSILLTGDKTLGLDSFIAEVLPHQKLEKIKELQSKVSLWP